MPSVGEKDRGPAALAAEAAALKRWGRPEAAALVMHEKHLASARRAIDKVRRNPFLDPSDLRELAELLTAEDVA